ncbi:MAG: carboxypeptidase-like regulatory domain-containing protein [Vicingaceae bacterium]
MRAQFSFFILFFLSLLSFGQGYQGRLIDSSTRQPLSFAHIVLIDSSFGLVAGFKGSFSMPQEFDNRKFKVSALGYRSAVFSVDSTTFSKPIVLQPMSYQLNEVTVNSPDYKRKWLNDFRSPSFGTYGLRNGGEVATFIHESDQYPFSLLQEVSVFIQNLNDNNFLRLHVYDYNIVCSCPGNELLDTSYLINGGYKNEWVQVDLRKSRIEIPENGFFVSIEGLRKQDENKNDTIEIGGYSKRFNFGNYTFRKDFLGKWRSQNTSGRIDVINVLNLAVKTDIAFDKKEMKMKLKKNDTQIKYKPYPKRKIKRLFDTRKVTSHEEYSNRSFEELIQSIYKAIEKDDIPYMVDHLLVFQGDAKKDVFEELEKRKERASWINEDERIEILGEWQNILDMVDDAMFTKIDLDKFKVEFSDINNTVMFVQTNGKNWKMLSNYYTVLQK